LIAASTGVEIASFNIAYLCEEDPDKIVSTLFEKECIWRYYNQSVIVNANEAYGYSLTKMGDYHFERINQLEFKENCKQASEYYALAYSKGERQVIKKNKFNLSKHV
jgi:hypothetical protein